MNLANCEAEIRAAYALLTVTMRLLGRDSDGRPVLPEAEIVDATMKAAAGRCGAMVAAAIKRAKRDLILKRLGASRLDITPTVALHSAQRLMGRGVDMRALLPIFGLPGRTAANKSNVSPAVLESLEATIRTDLDALVVALDMSKAAIAREWSGSPERLAILADWAGQRGVEACVR